MQASIGLLRLIFAVVVTLFSLGAAANVATANLLSKRDVDKCFSCHDDKETQHAKGPHANSNCASCHTSSSDHLSTAKAKSMGTSPGKPDSMACQSCHKNDSKHMNWKFAEHYKAGVQCSDCHGVHTPKVNKRFDLSLWRADKNTKLCATCHEDVLARFNMRSHHPVKEGGLSCTSCHDQHGSNQTRLISKTAQCTQCHQNVRGPHVFEHPPAAEDCVNCHNPHGTPNRKLLTLAEPMLCLQCHSIAGNRHGQTGATNNTQRITGAVLRNCSTCHGTPHGSGFDQHLRF